MFALMGCYPWHPTWCQKPCRAGGTCCSLMVPVSIPRGFSQGDFEKVGAWAGGNLIPARRCAMMGSWCDTVHAPPLLAEELPCWKAAEALANTNVHKPVVASHHQGKRPTGMPEKTLDGRLREAITFLFILFIVPLLERLQLWQCVQFWILRN